MEPTSGSVILLGLAGVLGGFSDILVIIEFLTSTMQPEIHEIYKYTYDTRQNLIKLMEHIGAMYSEKLPQEIKSRLDSILEELKESFRLSGEARTHSVEIEVEATRIMLEMLQDFFEKQRDRVEELHEEYPFTSPLWPGAKIEDGQKTEETDFASADTGQLVASIQQLGEKIDRMSPPVEAAGVVEANFEAQAEAIAVKIVEKTGIAVSAEEKVTKEQVAEIISIETEKLPEQYAEINRMLEINQSIMYSYKDQLLRMEHMIQTKAMSFDQIYSKMVKRMWDDYKCGG